MKSRLLTITMTGAAFAALATPALARDQIRAVGSSTVYPFVTVAAEHFGQGGKFKTPIVESTGTGGGFKLFCEGVGENTPDLSDASRPITEGEKAACAKNGVTGIAEVKIGYDGIVLANKKGSPLFDLSKKQIFMALARELPGKDGKLAKNPNMTWKDVDPSLPATAIAVYGPPPTSGTRDAFGELVMEKGCEAFPAFEKAYPDQKERAKACQMMREDGKYIESGEDDNLIVQKLTLDPGALGIFGYSYYDENTSKVQASKIEGVLPKFENIESGKYGVSRSLFVYVKKQHIGIVPGIVEFMTELTGDAAIGPDGYVVMQGLLPLKAEELKQVQASVKALAGK